MADARAVYLEKRSSDRNKKTDNDKYNVQMSAVFKCIPVKFQL